MTSPESPEMPAISLAAPAKVNLTLHVTGKRDDGFHLLESVIGFTAAADHLTFTRADKISLSVSGPEAKALDNEDDNIVLRAARLAQHHVTETGGVHIALDKYLPVAAGLGGGSADAAATLEGCLRLWGKSDAPPIDDAVLAAELGADVPVCRFGQAALVSGIGEKISALPQWPETWIVLANPRIPVATAAVFKAFAGPHTPSTGVGVGDNRWGPSVESFVQSLKENRNDLTDSARSIAPVISDVMAALDALPGCLLRRMSGSGPTCFGLFATEADAKQGAQVLSTNNPSWWVRCSELLATDQS